MISDSSVALTTNSDSETLGSRDHNSQHTEFIVPSISHWQDEQRSWPEASLLSYTNQDRESIQAERNSAMFAGHLFRPRIPLIRDYSLIRDYLVMRSSYEITLETLRTSCPYIAKRIDYLSTLSLDWDGYGAKVISPTAIEKCVRLLNTMDRRWYSREGDLFIAPMADGGLELEWKRVFSKELTLVIPPAGKIVQYLLTTFDPNGEAIDQEGVLSGKVEISALLSSVMAYTQSLADA